MSETQTYRDPAEPLEDQIERLASFILSLNREYPKEGGAVDTAIAMITDYTHRLAVKEAEIARHADKLVEVKACGDCVHYGGIPYGAITWFWCGAEPTPVKRETWAPCSKARRRNKE